MFERSGRDQSLPVRSIGTQFGVRTGHLPTAATGACGGGNNPPLTRISEADIQLAGISAEFNRVELLQAPPRAAGGSRISLQKLKET